MKILTGNLMRNLVHTIAIVSFLIWIIAFFKYDLNGPFHFFLVAAVIASFTRWLMEIKFSKKPK